jgi:exodeoxyribonuclease VII large subunit
VAHAAQAGRDRLIRLDRAQARAVAALFNRSRAKLETQGKLLFTLGYHNVLARGFALVRAADGTMVRRAAEVQPGAGLDIEFADGHVDAHADANARKTDGYAKSRQRRSDDKQGNLL